MSDQRGPFRPWKIFEGLVLRMTGTTGMNICACVEFFLKNSGMLASRQHLSSFVLVEKMSMHPIAWKLERGEIATEEELKRFGNQGQGSILGFIRSFEILERIGEVSYRLGALPEREFLRRCHRTSRCPFIISLEGNSPFIHPLHDASYPYESDQPESLCPEEPEFHSNRQE
ncbi:hypothetical protein Tco_1032234 [Tanacetum coccineum]|uniref:Uncharacterized protein n=1 Tax=Tanacetum coccineum TaxID=301880 RepID=A0ABQ4XYB6_9ASTR